MWWFLIIKLKVHHAIGIGDKTMKLLALDPGTTHTAALTWCTSSESVISSAIFPNEELIKLLEVPFTDILYIEMVACYGMPVGREVFETVLWIGRFQERWSKESELVYRRDIKIHLCNSARAKDGNIRQSLIDRYGEPGTKKAPGKLYGIKSHLWAALAVAVYASDKKLDSK